MKTNESTRARSGIEPAAAQRAPAGSATQRNVATTPRQAGEAAHIAQLKGEAKPKGKASTPKKGKGA